MSEFAWIEKYLKPVAASPAAMSLANDVACLSNGLTTPTIVTMDTLVEGVHFLKSDPLEMVGKKLVRVNVSDILCKGGRPVEALLSIAMPQRFTEEEFNSLSVGLGEDCNQFGISLLGGDTVRFTGPLTLSLTLIGQCLGDGPILRSGATPGDYICVTGAIGRGFLGLQAALSGAESEHLSYYRAPELPVPAWAEVLSSYATASIDISDGLIADAEHISTQSRISMDIELSDVPWAKHSSRLEDILPQATGGDDYQTLFSINPKNWAAFIAVVKDRRLPYWKIGTVRDGRGISLFHLGKPVSLPAVKGYEH